MNLTNYKCNEQRTLNSGIQVYKEGRKYVIQKDEKYVVLTEKELIKVIQELKKYENILQTM